MAQLALAAPPLERALIAVDGSATSIATLRLALTVLPLHVQLRVVYVVDRSMQPGEHWLKRLFEADGGVKRVIRQERLRAIRSHMLDEGDSRSIEDLALAYGFSSDWSLTRAFREVYGVTPASLRRAVSATSHDPAAVPSIRDIVQS